jgi:threonine dehydratase
MAALSTTLPLNRDSVCSAHKVVKDHVHRTPVVTNKTLSELASTPRTAEDLKNTRFVGKTPAKPVLRLWFKCENLQRIGAFKVRGAFYALHKLSEEPGWLEGGGKEKGVVTHSSGKIVPCLSLFILRYDIRNVCEGENGRLKIELLLYLIHGFIILGLSLNDLEWLLM